MSGLSVFLRETAFNVDIPEILRHIIVSVLTRLRGHIRPVTVNQDREDFFSRVILFGKEEVSENRKWTRTWRSV
jgi:hypothetical protein